MTNTSFSVKYEFHEIFWRETGTQEWGRRKVKREGGGRKEEMSREVEGKERKQKTEERVPIVFPLKYSRCD